jgi:hypothetical protein
LKLTKIKKDIPNLEFKEISNEFVHKQINKTSVKKATGRDGISAKLLKLAKPVIAKPITKMINKTITNSVLPDQPCASSLSNNNLCGRQSKALDRSISTAAMYLFWSCACFQSSIIFSSVVLHP